MIQLGPIIDTCVVFYVQFSVVGADDWFRYSQWQGDTIDAANQKLAEYAADLPPAYELSIVREIKVTEVVKG